VGRRDRGYTLLELVVVLCVFGVLLGLFLERLTFYAAAAERTAMEMQVRSFKMGLQLRLAELIVTNRQGDADELEVENPAVWLAEKPSNYGGEFRAGADAGNWYFDASAHQLIYAVNNARYLETEAGDGVKYLRFQVKLVRDRLDPGGGRNRSVSGVALVPVHPYRWSRG
jgi:prepilin-type N-terminal cleavage/methylation domain-containing protein